MNDIRTQRGDPAAYPHSLESAVNRNKMDPSDPLWEFRIKSYRATMCIQRQEKVCLQIKRSEWSFPGLVPLGPFSPAFFFPLSWLLPGLPSRLILLYQSILSRCSSRLNCALSTLLYPLFLGSLILPGP